MFIKTSVFNHPLNWNTSTVTSMFDMFNGAAVFNQDLSSWNVSACTNFMNMFNGASQFNNGLSSGTSGTLPWIFNSSTSISINMQAMFALAPAFNQIITSWNVERVTTFTSMFNGATKFNNGLTPGTPGTWTWTFSILPTDNINMQGMFTNDSSFNQDIGGWDTQRVTNMNSMLYGTSAFNNGGSDSIKNWNTSNVTGMASMFQNTVVFNQPIGSWDVSKVTNMNGMFAFTGAATSFNQNIGSWNVSNVTDFNSFMIGKTTASFSAANLDAIYNGWSSRPVQPGEAITFQTAKYTAAGAAGRAILTGAPNNWVITDGGI